MNTMAFSLPRYLGMKDDFPYAGIFDLIALLSSTFALLIGGTYFFSKALASLRHRTIHIDLPIALGLAFAYAGSIVGWLSGAAHLLYFDFVATFTVLNRTKRTARSTSTSTSATGSASSSTEIKRRGTGSSSRGTPPLSQHRWSCPWSLALRLSAFLQQSASCSSYCLS
jgi:Cu2+-exporting ATPase